MYIFKQFARFTSVGVIGTAVHYGVLIACVQKLGIDPVPSTALGAGSGALVNYILNYYLTFNSKRRHLDAAPKFLTIAIIGMALNALSMWLVVPYIHYLLAQLTATAIVLFWNFVLNRFWTFQVKTA